MVFFCILATRRTVRKKSVFLETRKNERERISSMLIVVSQSCVSAVSWSGPRNRPRLIHTTSPRQRCLCVTLPLDSFPLWRRTTAVNPGSLVVIGELFINRRCRLVGGGRERERERTAIIAWWSDPPPPRSAIPLWTKKTRLDGNWNT